MANVIEIAELPEEKMLEELKQKPFNFYKDLKHLPDPIGSKIYKDLQRRWEAAEARVTVLEELVKSVKWEDGSVEEDRYDIISELMDKAMQGFEINDEHAHRKIPMGHRLVLEARLLEGMNNSFDIVESVLRDFYGKDRNYANIERADLRLEIRLMDAMYTEVHTSFLKSYLEMEW